MGNSQSVEDNKFKDWRKGEVEFTINKKKYSITKELSGITLNTFIREHAQLPGTKAMCLEGGCGACIVAVTLNWKKFSVNSCLVPVYICNGWSIETVEGIGNSHDGYNAVQAALAEHNGSQCGFCSPGMVMSMYSLMNNETPLTMKEIENSFASNICRCTGYRPILDAFKSFASDAPAEMVNRLHDIEEAYKVKSCPKTGKACKGSCQEDFVKIEKEDATEKFNYLISDNDKEAKFYRVFSIEAIFTIFTNSPDATYIMNGGHTSHGVYRITPKDIYIDVNGVPDLKRIEKTPDCLVLGGDVSLSDLKDSLMKHSKEEGFQHFSAMADHVDVIASIPVRNIGTIAGNLMIKHQHNEFPSDLFLILETSGAEIHILSSPTDKICISLFEFLKLDMNHKLIYSIKIPKLTSQQVYRSYKIAPRAQNAHAHVNAGFLFTFDDTFKVLSKPNVIFGGINPTFTHAFQTELFLIGKNIFEKSVLKGALDTLDLEMKPNHALPDYSPEFRKNLALGLFYKFVLSIKPEKITAKYQSGGAILQRGLSSAKQTFDTDKTVWPLNKAIPKIESIYQTSGTGQYTNDVKPAIDQVHCAFVTTKVATGTIASVDATKALAMDGVVAFFTAKDVPGKNSFIISSLVQSETLFADKNIEYAGQPVGVIVAKSHLLANKAAKLVTINYDPNPPKPLITIQDVVNSKIPSRIVHSVDIPAKGKGTDVQHVVKGSFECGMQYHFTMEPQSCVCIPVEDGMDVVSSTQWMDLVQTSIAGVLNVKQNSINMSVRRLGGGYGCKISRSNFVACACALVCHKLNRVARMVLTIESNMDTIGKRVGSRNEYEAGVDASGKVQYLNSKYWCNNGSSVNEGGAGPVSAFYTKVCYELSNWSFQGYDVQTDLPSNTWCRAPGSVEAMSFVEDMMEHIAAGIGKDPESVKIANFNDVDKPVLMKMMEDLKKSADYDNRKAAVDTFNLNNRWKKKGMSLVPMKYALDYGGNFNALVSIFAGDGTVSITHGGIEMGQGLHTKVAQVAAFTLGIDLNLVTVKPSNVLTAPNNIVSGGSVSSESCAFATMKACQELLKRLEPIKEQMKYPTWQALVKAANAQNVDLCARYMVNTANEIKTYSIYGVTIAEVELDLLTGQHIVRRVDLIEDAGISLSPQIDVGQIEGAFVMGLGYWTSEDLIYDPSTGALTNNRTWNYKPPGAKDIPEKFNVTLRKNSANESGVLRSKATGEPPLCMSFCVSLAIRRALDAGRKDAGDKNTWYQLDGPATTEKILMTSLTNKEQMTL